MAHSTNDASFEQDVLQHAGLVLVDFWAEWCPPCQKLLPIIDDLSKEMESTVKILKMNIDESPNTPTKYGIRGIPTLLLFKNGKHIDTKSGALPKSTLKSWLESHAN